MSNRITRIWIALLAIAALTLAGCDRNNATDPVSETDLSATQDAAESMASAVGEETGGLTDQMGDVLTIASDGGMDNLGKTDGFQQVSRTFDPATGTWTLTLERERGIVGGVPYAYIYRVYTYQFQDANGDPQMFYITNGDTARTILFDIVEGEGRHKTRRVSQQLHNLAGSFVLTNTHQPLVTINGSYERAAADTITTRNAVRTLENSLEFTVTDLVGPRGVRRDLAQAISGTISGTYEATITWTRGDAYRETTINRSFTIVLGDGTATITIGGQSFVGDVESGELLD